MHYHFKNKHDDAFYDKLSELKHEKRIANFRQSRNKKQQSYDDVKRIDTKHIKVGSYSSVSQYDQTKDPFKRNKPKQKANPQARTKNAYLLK